ncbi:caspase recruitment domain-containing protein 11-like isoform X1 [Haliotis asinina]|uniref:caspase recruitment domain-containing protein 11-like isoform X1 n=1 Tax=Haliotis asinina TaxID=109174 RepID=UPI0035326C83
MSCSDIMDNVQQTDMDDSSAERTKLDYSSLTEDNYCDFLEDHFNDLIRFISPPVFFGELRTARVLSESDCDEINNFYCNPTRRARARTFLNILLTKGLDGFKHFMECLEYEYPHVFQKVTNRIAKSPPSGYERHNEGRISQNLEEFSRMGFRVANLNNQRNDLFNQLEELQSMLEYAEKENKDLEREIASLRPYAMDNQQLLEKQLEADKEIRNLKDENREFMRKNIQYRDDIERQMSRIDELLVDREDLENKLKERNNELERMNQSQDVLIEKFEEERKKSQRLINIATRRERHADDNADRPRAQTRIEILQCDLDAEREKVKEMIETLEMTQADLSSERQTSETLRLEKLKLQRDCDQSQLFLKHAERRNEQYFKTIQQLEKEKRKAEEEKILVQQKCWDISDQKQRLFVAKHNLEQKYDRLRQNYERIRSDCRSKPEEAVDGDVNTLTLRPISPIRQRLSPVSVRSPLPLLKTTREDTDSSAIQEGASQPHPRQPGVMTLPATFKKGDDDQSNDTQTCQQTFSVRNPVTRPSCERGPTTKGLRPPIARKPRMKSHSDSMVVNISASMKKVFINQHPAADDDSDPTCRSDDDYDSHDEDNQSASGFSIDQETSSSGSSDVQRDADVFCIRSDLLPADSQYLRWFDSQTGMGLSNLEMDGGEQKMTSESEENLAKLNMKNFYVRSNVTWEDQSKEGSIPIQEGEFLYISDILKPTFFVVNKVEPTTGHHMKRRASGTVPDYELAKMYTRRSSQGVITPEPQGNKGLTRRVAIRNRDYSPYTVIAPLKALMKLPVLLSGQRALVDAILDILVAEADEWATTIKKPVTRNQRQNWREMCDLLRHTIMPSWGISHQSDRDQHRYIVINIKLMSEDCQEQLRDIFGQDFNDVQCDKETAPSKWSLHSETVTLPSPKIRNRGDLMTHLKEKIMNVQDNIFWMTISWKTINALKNSA